MAFNNVSKIYFAEMLAELLRREKEAKIKPDPDIDAYMKVSIISTLTSHRDRHPYKGSFVPFHNRYRTSHFIP